jgi:hypothetical protein
VQVRPNWAVSQRLFAANEGTVASPGNRFRLRHPPLCRNGSIECDPRYDLLPPARRSDPYALSHALSWTVSVGRLQVDGPKAVDGGLHRVMETMRTRVSPTVGVTLRSSTPKQLR